MITGKTSTGFEYSVDPKKLKSMVIIRRLAKIGEIDDTTYVLKTYEMIMGEKQLDALCEHCDTLATDDKTGADVFDDVMTEIFIALEASDEVKNS